MKKLPTLLLAIALSASTLSARDWHVAAIGNDANDGSAPDKAFATLKKAASQLQPGDTLLVGDGVYTNADPNDAGAVCALDQRGRPDAWITVKAAPGAHPELRPTGWNGVQITGTYIIIDGLTVTGANDSITLQDAFADGVLKEKDGKPYGGSPRFNSNGICIEGRKNAIDRKPHHIIVRHCTVSKCPGGGIAFLEADHFTVEDCVVYGNAWYMRYAGSGITALNDWASDDAPGYHVVIQRNLVWDNKVLVPWSAIGKLSDGNGILLDVTDKKAGGAANPTEAAAAGDPNDESLNPDRPEWKYRALIANNLSCYNGGSGIHTFRTAHVDIVNNTVYWNGQVVGYPDLFANSSTDVVFLNNIIVPRPAGKVTDNANNHDLRWDYNLYPGQAILTGEHDLHADPLFVKIHADLRDADFHLRKTSPGIDSGTNDLPQPTDLTGVTRPAGQARDRGAYEQ